MKRYLISLLIISFACLPTLRGQQRADSVGVEPVSSTSATPTLWPTALYTRELQILDQQWETTTNAAGMGYNLVDRGSLTTLGYRSAGGDYHRAQEAARRSGLNFNTQRYDSFNSKIYVKGYFDFLIGREKERAWSDVMNTYNSNPYIFGSSVKGQYDLQQYSLGTRIFTTPIGRFNYGLTLDYKVADLARQRDPRTRTYTLNYTISPSVTYAIDQKNRVGLEVNYAFDKERMPSISTVQDDPNLYYYTFYGLERVIGKVGGYKAFYRQFAGDTYGISAQYNYDSEDLRVLLSAGVAEHDQDVIGLNHQTPGSYNEYLYNLGANVLFINGDFINNFTLKADFKNAGANEFIQELVYTKNPVTGVVSQNWYTLFVHKNRVIIKTTDIEAQWRMFMADSYNDGYIWSVGAQAAYSSFSNRAFLPTSIYESSRFFVGLNGSVAVINNHKAKLMISGKGVASFNVNNKLETATTTPLLTNVLLPDLAFHRKRAIEGYIDAKYTFPLVLGKGGTPSFGYIKLYFDKTLVSGWDSWVDTGLTLGLLTF